jgi:signal transduction histidine kinase
MGDRHRLGQVADNLVSNAIKFTPGGGTVTVRVAADDNRALLEVADTGIGIAADEIERLFERMYRSPEVERRQIQGTGLGLTIAKAIVDAHDGRISATSEPGAGTTFTVELPLADG